MPVAVATSVSVRRSNDRKVSPLVRRQGSKDAPALGNSFGLPAGISCPGATSVCEAICYAGNLERAWSSVSAVVRSNWDALQSLGDDVHSLTELLADMVADFVREAERLAAKGRRSLADLLVFRIHWDGDFYSDAYAKAWRNVILRFPDVRFWNYTRSFTQRLNVVPQLVDLPNLALYLSVDSDNVKRARLVLKSHPAVRMAALADTQSEAADVVVGIRGRNAPACPENVGRLPLVVALDGRRSTAVEVGDDAQGACTACGLCVNGMADVRFAITGR